MNIREKISEIIERELHPIADDKRNCTHQFYYRNYASNLICPMSDKHVAEYSVADGGEMEAKGRKPAKMASLTSSSAMTFNILGNETAIMKQGQPFAAGRYDVTYEKQMYTLNKGSNPANLDAFLSNRAAGEAVFCEMKMMEWLGTPNALKEAYCNRDYYFDPSSFDDVFSQIINDMRKSDLPNERNAFPSVFRQYDAWQMFKHTLAIYNTTSKTTHELIAQKTGSMVGEFKKITLVNVVFEMDEDLISDEELRIKYLRALQLEHEEADYFVNTMLSPNHGLVDLFAQNCGVEFDIRYIPVKEFVSMFEKTPDELAYLRRYCC